MILLTHIRRRLVQAYLFAHFGDRLPQEALATREFAVGAHQQAVEQAEVIEKPRVGVRVGGPVTHGRALSALPQTARAVAPEQGGGDH